MEKLLAALAYLNCAELTYNEWLQVGMALHHEGCPWTAWDEWSKTDPARYHSGECERRWNTFRGSDNPVTGGTVIRMALDRGFTWNDRMEWDVELREDEPAPCPPFCFTFSILPFCPATRPAAFMV